MNKLSVLIVAVFMSGCVSLITPKVEGELLKLKAGQYSLDKTHGTLLFKIQHLGLSTYVGRFNSFDASLKFDPNDIKAATLSVLVDIDSLDINNPSLKNDLMGRSWFKQNDFPQASFTSTKATPTSDTQFEFIGDLNWRGVVKPITVNATFHGGANNILSGKYTLGFSATGTFLRSDFGMGKYAPLVGDEVKVEAYAELVKN